MGKSTIKWPCSIAMLNYQRVKKEDRVSQKGYSTMIMIMVKANHWSEFPPPEKRETSSWGRPRTARNTTKQKKKSFCEWSAFEIFQLKFHNVSYIPLHPRQGLVNVDSHEGLSTGLMNHRFHQVSLKNRETPNPQTNGVFLNGIAIGFWGNH